MPGVLYAKLAQYMYVLCELLPSQSMAFSAITQITFISMSRIFNRRRIERFVEPCYESKMQLEAR